MQKLDLTLFFHRVGFLSFLFFEYCISNKIIVKLCSCVWNMCQTTHGCLLCLLPTAHSNLVQFSNIRYLFVPLKYWWQWKLKSWSTERNLLKEHHNYSDPVTDFLTCLYVKYDFDEAQKKLRQCEEVFFFFIFIYSSHLQICYMDSFHFLLFVHAKIWSIDCAYRRLHMTSVRTEILKSGKWQLLLLWIVGGHEYNLLNFDCSGYAISSFDEVKFSSSFCYSFSAIYWQICYLWNL